MRPFVISTGSMTEVHSYVLRLADDDGSVGHGEAVPAPRVTGEALADVERTLRALQAAPRKAVDWLTVAERAPGRSATPAVQAALTAAALDVEGRRANVPLHRLLNLPEGSLESSVTISLGPPEAALREAEEWDRKGWSTFKLKLGGPDDEAVVRALRDRFPEKRIRVDANEAWTPQVAEARLAFLERHGVEFVEQPLRRDLLDECAALARKFDVPIILDESLLEAADALELVRREAGDGGNIKLAKCGGPFEARRIVKVLRDAGWSVMMGCMVESSLGLSTAAAFAGVLDHADLDGNVTIARDPWRGFAIREGRVATPEAPGVGVALDPSAPPLEPLHPT